MSSFELLRRLMLGGSLGREKAREALNVLLDEGTSDAARGAILSAWAMKGATGEELAGLTEGAMGHAAEVDLGVTGPLVDTAGTGGGRSTLNLSTGAAILAAGAGVKVAKHGNRAVTSRVGSADVLEALGVDVDGGAETARAQMARAGAAFLFAPAFHPAFRAVGAARRALGIRTVFNLVGPLSNPARADRRLIGVWDERLLEPVADALSLLGLTGVVVYGVGGAAAEGPVWAGGGDGLDEVNPVGETRWIRVSADGAERGSWWPGDFGISADDAQGAMTAPETAEQAADRLRNALAGGAEGAALVPGAAVATWIGGGAESLPAAVVRVQSAWQEGAGAEVLGRLRTPEALS